MLTLPFGSLAFPVALVALVPDVAGACPGYYDPCDGLEGWAALGPVNAAKIPTDGVLVLRGDRVGAGDPFAGVVLEVTRDGQPIAGALETTASPDVLVWRPAEAWEPGAAYALTGAVSNPVGADACLPAEIPLSAAIAVDTEPGAALAAPTLTAEPSFTLAAVLSLQTLACCEGAPPPTQGYGGCGGTYLDFDPAQCGATAGHGSFSLAITGQPATTGPAAAQILYTLQVDDGAQAPTLDLAATLDGLTAPVCVRFTAEDLATGATAEGAAQCFGDEFAGQLGPQPVEPALDCPLEQCAVVNDASWDPNMCQPFDPGGADSDTPTSGDSDPGSEGSGSDTDPDQDGDKACACSDAPDAPPALLALAALLALPRRRR